MASNRTRTGGRRGSGSYFLISQLGNACFSSATPGVGDLGAVEVELLQIGQPFEVHQPRVGDLGSFKVESLQVGQPLCDSPCGTLRSFRSQSVDLQWIMSSVSGIAADGQMMRHSRLQNQPTPSLLLSKR